MMHRYMSASDLCVRAATGEDVGSCLTSLRYNSTISAFELRGPRNADPAVETIPDLTGKSPLHIFAMGRRVFLIHFETVTRIPFEVNVGTRIFVSDEGGRRIDGAGVAEELVILRGARVETIPIPSIEEERQLEGVAEAGAPAKPSAYG